MMKILGMLLAVASVAHGQASRFTFCTTNPCLASMYGVEIVTCTTSGHIGNGNAGCLLQCDIAEQTLVDPIPPVAGDLNGSAAVTCPYGCTTRADSVATVPPQVEIVQTCLSLSATQRVKRRARRGKGPAFVVPGTTIEGVVRWR